MCITAFSLTSRPWSGYSAICGAGLSSHHLSLISDNVSIGANYIDPCQNKVLSKKKKKNRSWTVECVGVGWSEGQGHVFSSKQGSGRTYAIRECRLQLRNIQYSRLRSMHGLFLRLAHVQLLKKLSQCLAVFERLGWNKSNKLSNTLKIKYVILHHLGFWKCLRSCDSDQN